MVPLTVAAPPDPEVRVELALPADDVATEVGVSEPRLVENCTLNEGRAVSVTVELPLL